jgi:methyl-accepting chemotaxis protein
VALIAKGAIPEQITAQTHGEFADIQDSINELIRASGDITATARKIADGNLTVAIRQRSPEDELMSALGDMVANLNQALGQVSDSSAEIASGATQMRSSTETVAVNNQRSAASIEEIGATMVQIASQVRSNADNATEAMGLATTARDHSEDGNRKMTGMISAMTEIEAASQDVYNIIKVIDEIAFQTNLLALNAAVEAARAGEHGKGFAVVAEEVRNLAERSAKAAKETAQMITGSIRKVSQGSEIAKSTAEVFGEIVGSVTKAADLVRGIASASTEQAHGMEQINQGLAQLDQVVQGNAASSEEMVSAGQMLLSQTQKLEETLQRFELARQTGGAGGEITPELLAAFQAFMAAQGGAPAARKPAGQVVPFGGGGQRKKAVNDAAASFPLDESDMGRY